MTREPTERELLDREQDERSRADLGQRGFRSKPIYDCAHDTYWATCNACHPYSRRIQAP